ncbi:HAD superfamily hydrolase [Paucilactobacillus oligofermentans DSM 15707 = LMG 22743]|uniref:HAD superfamily hydrolase n=1 Tax=Paucilactobacillus oligofermentans DSM 15707 = LMG 22743 TaxID=1423778 RepID=A0A0R1RVX4_9LACO|nr:sugar-phosphatase [Paucilactobacillus oligofermentans]KRL58165.1 HAD superfamily hydrolase [Paucilactobacillus oligofermentans DSM 15707 = LMG 22743]CUS26870.1 Uncharacterized protein YidA [Paucilactobacillus oligofermentans DSM 15707 = LMG 22743]
MAIKLVAIDIDGTLVTDEKQLTNETITAINAATAQGVKVVLCTGRPLNGVQAYLKKLGLADQAESYVITFNGSLVQNTNGDIIVRHTVAFNDYLDMELLSRKAGLHFHVETDQFIYTANRDISPYSIAESFLVNTPIKYRTVDEMTDELSFSKGMLIDDPALITKALTEKTIPDEFYERFYIVRSEPYFLELMNKDASKGNAIRDLAGQLDIKQDEIMALGDQENDLTMIDYAGLGVAMGNAIDEVKAHANQETLTNQKNGVAAAINKYVLNK